MENKKSDSGEFRPHQKELARKLLVEKFRSNSKIPYTKLVSRREFSTFSVSRFKVLFQNEWRNIEDEARRIAISKKKQKNEEERMLQVIESKEKEKEKVVKALKAAEVMSEALHNIKRKTQSEVKRVQEETKRIRQEADEEIRKFMAEIEVLAEKNKRSDARLQLVTKTIEELEREREIEMTRVMLLYEEERAKNVELSSRAKDGDIFRTFVKLDYKVNELAKDIANTNDISLWTMNDKRRAIQKEVIRLRRANYRLFERNIHPDEYFYDNDINTNIQNWWEERCAISHDPRRIDIIDHDSYELLASVILDMIDQISSCRKHELLSSIRIV